MTEQELIEALSREEHRSWADWMNHVFDIGKTDEQRKARILENKLRADFPGLNVSVLPQEYGYALNYEGSLPSEDVRDAVAKTFRRYRQG